MASLRKLVNANSTKGLISDIYGSLIVSGQEGGVENKNRIKNGREMLGHCWIVNGSMHWH